MEKHELRTNNVKDHKDLDVWNKAMDLVEDIYILSKKFPHDEIYGLSSQIKRAVVSIPSNIAEGAERRGSKEFVQYLYISMGSLAEVETQILLAQRLKFIADIGHILEKIVNIRQMLHGLIRYLNRNLQEVSG